MNKRFLSIAGIAGFALIVILSNTLYIVEQTQQALVLEFGKPVRIVKKPGLRAKVPFLQNVVFFDNRLLELTVDQKEVIAADQKRLIVDAFVRYRIVDPLKFYQSVSDERIMQSRLNSIVDSSLRQVLGSRPLSSVLSSERTEIMKLITAIVNSTTSGIPLQKVTDGTNPNEIKTVAEAAPPGGFGVEVVDVRIMRADLPNENSQAIFRRMQTEREREAKEFRAQGEEEAQRIRSRADRDRTVIIAEAQKKADTLRGQGDAEAIDIFAGVTARDPEFYGFYRTMQAYKNSIKKEDTTVILSPDSEFMKYMR